MLPATSFLAQGCPWEDPKREDDGSNYVIQVAILNFFFFFTPF